MRSISRATRLALALTALLGFALTTVRAADEVTGDLKKLQGTWVKAGDEGPDLRWVFEGDKLNAEVNGQAYKCKIKVDDKAAPNHTADINVIEGPDDSSGKTAKAIYKFDGDRLVMCISHPGGERPTEFQTVEGSAFVLAFKKDK